MTLDAWLAARAPVPPPRLAARLREALGERTSADAAVAPHACLAAADILLRDLLARPSAGRDSALDLLTVDALATYAFEAAAESPESLPALAAEAMRRFAASSRP